MTNDVPALFCFFSLPASNRGFKQRFKSRVWSGRGREEGFRGERGGVVDETYISGRHKETCEGRDEGLRNDASLFTSRENAPACEMSGNRPRSLKPFQFIPEAKDSRDSSPVAWPRVCPPCFFCEKCPMGFSRIIPKLWLSDFLVEYNGKKKQQNGQHNFQNHSIEWEN